MNYREMYGFIQQWLLIYTCFVDQSSNPPCFGRTQFKAYLMKDKVAIFVLSSSWAPSTRQRFADRYFVPSKITPPLLFIRLRMDRAISCFSLLILSLSFTYLQLLFSTLYLISSLGYYFIMNISSFQIAMRSRQPKNNRQHINYLHCRSQSICDFNQFIEIYSQISACIFFQYQFTSLIATFIASISFRCSMFPTLALMNDCIIQVNYSRGVLYLQFFKRSSLLYFSTIRSIT